VEDLVEDLTLALGRENWLFVIDSLSTRMFKTEEADFQQIAEKLGVQYVLRGSFRRSADDVRIVVQLTDAITSQQVWSERFNDRFDNSVIPASEGSNALGCYLAFQELIRAGEIERMPRLFVSQPENCAPLHHALQGTQQREFKPTVAEGTAVQSPVRLSSIVGAVQKTGGNSVTIPEDEIIAVSKRLARAGILTEPSSAHAWAGARRFIENGEFASADQTVVILTGSGLKAQSVYAD
jgi:threonine synthase